MHLTRQTWIQLAVLIVISVTALAYMMFDYMRLPSVFFGVGHYTITVHLPRAAGLYERANVTYRGSDIGEVKSVRLTDSGVDATLSLRSDVKIPANLEADVHSSSAVGEQYVALLPRNSNKPDLKDGDVIAVGDTRVPPDINDLLGATNRGLEAIPGADLQTAVDESYTAVGGLGPDIGRFVKGSTSLAIDSYSDLPAILNVIDNLGPVLDTQSDTSDAVQAWAAHLSTVTDQLRRHDADVRGTITNGSGGAEAVRSLIEKVQPTVPIIAANLASIAPVLVTYRPDLEQLLVLLPQGVADVQAISLANRGTKQSYKGGYLSFNLNTNLPPPCTTGFLPAQQQRAAALVDYPERPAGDLYCRVPQDSPFNVRGARNVPCETRPGKRAPTVKMCESDENYVPLNDGMSWKGDPNATLTGQPIPQLSSATAPAGGAGQNPPAVPAPSTPIAAVGYDPATGTYVGPDGHVYTQGNLSHSTPKDKTWQNLLIPPSN